MTRLSAAAGLTLAGLTLACLSLAGLSLACTSAFPSDEPEPPLETRVILKSGKVLVGEVRGTSGGLIDFVSADGEELPLSRRHVRVVESGGPHADPPILWNDPPRGLSKPPRNFVRVSRNDSDAGGPRTGSLDVGVSAYEEPVSGRRIYLVGAVHIAHPETFEAQQAILDSMDLVLWEGVGAKEAPTVETLERFDILFKSQVMLKNILNLEFQLEQVDYERSYWQNSDMGINDVQAALDERGLSMIPNEEMFRAIFGTIFAFIDPEDIPRNETVGRMYRGMVAPFMQDPDRMFEQAGAEGLKEVLLEMRNEVVIADLKSLLAEPGAERIGVYYGAAHLTGIDEALRDDLGLRFLGVHWIPAWRY